METNGICMRIAEQGADPLVVPCHGFPDSWYSWRHQLPVLAQFGMKANEQFLQRDFNRQDKQPMTVYGQVLAFALAPADFWWSDLPKPSRRTPV